MGSEGKNCVVLSLQLIADEREAARIAAHANTIKEFIKRATGRYYEPIRVIARRALEKKRRETLLAAHAAREARARATLTHYVTKRRDKELLAIRFAHRKAELERLRVERARAAAAQRIQDAWWRYQDKLDIIARAEERKKRIEAERQYRQETAAAIVMQRFARRAAFKCVCPAFPRAGCMRWRRRRRRRVCWRRRFSRARARAAARAVAAPPFFSGPSLGMRV